MQTEPTPEHQWLQQMVGEWEFEHECNMGPDQPPMKSHGREVVRQRGVRLQLGGRHPRVVPDDRRRRRLPPGAGGSDRRVAGPGGDPPEFGYGAVDGNELQEETLVFVVDILGVQHVAATTAP